jgi:hypothetical protein
VWYHACSHHFAAQVPQNHLTSWRHFVSFNTCKDSILGLTIERVNGRLLRGEVFFLSVLLLW